MNTRELAQASNAPEYFIWRQLKAGSQAGKINITKLPGKGNFWYADPLEVAGWLEEKGHAVAARRLHEAAAAEEERTAC